ncbi:enoyl-CoA hydratase-related protein [Priestia koreensis]|uniref:enoyl-CoA hydratase-related protein n=1 Tax=Priestia koreensis TaxID=284581 RepID=UPI001F5A974D|nr:enoyl-CoA hydratase-related protein [Priestia koreensis]MCM3004787.1 enoyl-CoA hydratase-related protein [Priestia koreensis]UNL85586.1 enoyl-CoA hydratase/isomerase family protein [Priestia koreensis]
MKTVQYSSQNHVGTITLNRPDALNAFNYQMLSELEEIVEGIRINPDVRVVVIQAAGEKAFSVGADLKERKTLTIDQVKRNVYKIGEVFAKVEQLPQPTIAVLNGYAFGGGMELALACDFRIAADHATVGLTETSLAIIPGAGGTQRLPRLIGESKALELILTAKRVTAVEGDQYGLFTRVVPAGQLEGTIQEFVGAILRNGPVALQQAKFAVKEGMKVDLQTGLHIERKAYELTIPTEDRLEALQAFSEKRPPVFKGK